MLGYGGPTVFGSTKRAGPCVKRERLLKEFRARGHFQKDSQEKRDVKSYQKKKITSKRGSIAGQAIATTSDHDPSRARDGQPTLFRYEARRESKDSPAAGKSQSRLACCLASEQVKMASWQRRLLLLPLLLLAAAADAKIVSRAPEATTHDISMRCQRERDVRLKINKKHTGQTHTNVSARLAYFWSFPRPTCLPTSTRCCASRCPRPRLCFHFCLGSPLRISRETILRPTTATRSFILETLEKSIICRSMLTVMAAGCDEAEFRGIERGSRRRVA